MRLKIFITIIFIGIVSLGYNQNELEGYESKKVEILKRVGNKIVSSNEGNIIETFERNSNFYTFYKIYNKNKETYWMEKFDLDFNLIGKVELKTPKITYLQGVYEMKENMIFSFVERNGSTYNLKLCKFNFEAFSFETKPFYIKEIPRKNLSFLTAEKVGFKPRKLDITFLTSPDKNKFSIVESQIKKFSVINTLIKVYKKDLSLDYEKTIDYNNIKKMGGLNTFRKPLLCNSGKIYGVYFSIKSRLSGNAISRILTINKKEIIVSEIIPNCLDDGLAITWEGFEKIVIYKNQLNIVSFTGGRKKLGPKFQLTKDAKLQLIKLSANGKKFINKGNIAVQEELWEGNFRKAYKDLRIRQVDYNEDGSLLINLEEYVLINMGGNSGLGIVYRDILVLKIGANNKVLWSSRIEKVQSDNLDRYNGYAFYKNNNGNYCYIFNSNAKNFPEYSHKSKFDGTVQHITLNNENGSMIKNELISTDSSFEMVTEDFKKFENSFVIGDWISYIYFKQK